MTAVALDLSKDGTIGPNTRAALQRAEIVDIGGYAYMLMPVIGEMLEELYEHEKRNKPE